MAYLNATLWNDLQVSNATNEKRFQEKGLIDAVKASTPSVDYVPPSAQQALSSVSSLRAVKIPVIKDQTVTVTTSPGFANIPSNLAETAAYSFTAYDVFSGFRYYPAAHDNNQVDGEYFRNQTMLNVAHQMATSIESVLSTNFEARKTQVLGYGTQASQGDGTFTFNATPDELEISKAAQKENMFFYLANIMEANDMPGQYRLVTSRGGTISARAEYAKYSANNDKNLQALGAIPLDRLHESSNISTGDVWDGFYFRDGAIGMYENFPWDFRNGTEIAGRKWSVSDMEIPFCGMRANIYVNSEATDATALVTSGTDSNLIMSHFEEMAVWCRFYVVYRYNNDLSTRANDIVKVVGKAS